MDFDNISNWITKPNVCRCCLSGNGTWDLTTAYITDTGLKQVFADLLQHCFGISLSFIDEKAASHLVCDVCVAQLRNVSSFHTQVVKCNEQFSHYWISRNDDFQKVADHLDDTGSKQCAQDNFFDDIDNLSSPQSKSSQYLLKPRYNLKQKSSKQKKSASNEYDSDTPVARWKNTVLEECVNKVPQDRENRLKVCANKVEISIKDQTGKHKKNIKQISERKRIILTCSIVLLETTACPFRHHKSWFRCFFCTDNFMEINLLKNHYSKSHTDFEAEIKKIKRYPRSLQIEISNLECRHCCTLLTDVDKMAEHFVQEHNKVMYKECIADYKVDSSPYKCHLCDKEFHVFRTLTTHLNVHYANCICDVCGKSFINSKRLIVHRKTHENGAYPCTACGKVLKTKTSQSNHMESHSKRVVKCQICFKPMKHYNDRIKHMSLVHDITHKFKCPFCDRVYNIKHYLATHIRQTHGNKNKKCKVCNMAFITNHSLKKHMSKHTGERPFTCTICSKSYARSYTLREHMKAHENDK
ncbi:zinc finger protein 91 [Bicyclus anynana]|uniref:Zinc finger protein 91 n=1 Tax=Bicyclus anynana TaxID=110368 RepID=A0A6J1NK56_BICAN|nr:zinc finger protein 91 [Bicyclus anynana]